MSTRKIKAPRTRKAKASQPGAFEDICRANLLTLAKAYGRESGLALATISGKVYGQKSFLQRFADRKCTLTVGKMDAVIAAFRTHWPEGLAWPELAAIPPPAKMLGENPPR